MPQYQARPIGRCIDPCASGPPTYLPLERNLVGAHRCVRPQIHPAKQSLRETIPVEADPCVRPKTCIRAGTLGRDHVSALAFNPCRGAPMCAPSNPPRETIPAGNYPCVEADPCVRPPIHGIPDVFGADTPVRPYKGLLCPPTHSPRAVHRPGAGASKARRIPRVKGFPMTPTSVMIPEMYRWGVTSKAGFRAAMPRGATCRP